MPIGFHPTPDFKPKIPLDNLMMTKVVDNTSQKGRRTEAALNMFLLDLIILLFYSSDVIIFHYYSSIIYFE